MSTYANIKIITNNGQEFSTFESVQGEIRDVVRNICNNHFMLTNPYPSITITSEELDGQSLTELTRAYHNEVELEFIAVFSDEFGDEKRIVFDSSNFNEFYERAIINKEPVYEIDTNTSAYDTACLPSWISNVWDLSSHEESGINEKSLKIFVRYCQLFLEEQILFGIQINKIKKITLELS